METQRSNRLAALDALRGLAVLLMVLSGSIAFGGVLPAWMYHAQVPPPLHTFDPSIPGITWVDWVFPFFLFSMGAAIPLSLSAKLDQGSQLGICISVLKRYALLLFFAIFTFHARAWVMSQNPGLLENLLSIACFLLLFVIYSTTKIESKKLANIRMLCGLCLAIGFLFLFRFKGLEFKLASSDIIIVVLANMALFGSLIWIFTRHNKWARLAVLPVVMGVFLSAKMADSWPSAVFKFSPVPWAYTFYYLKYLFIIIPGTFAGEWLKNLKNMPAPKIPSSRLLLLPLLAISLIISNTALLFSRDLLLNLSISFILGAILLLLSKKLALPDSSNKMFNAGIYLLFLGLLFESFEGGIKKDPSNYSYYFVCTGMAFLMLVSFVILESLGTLKFILKSLSLVGQNPMIAYTAGNLFLIPLLRISSLESMLNMLNKNAWMGFSRGIIFTGIVALITIFFTRKKIFWKT